MTSPPPWISRGRVRTFFNMPERISFILVDQVYYNKTSLLCCFLLLYKEWVQHVPHKIFFIKASKNKQKQKTSQKKEKKREGWGTGCIATNPEYIPQIQPFMFHLILFGQRASLF